MIYKTSTIRDLLIRSDRAVCRAIIRIYTLHPPGFKDRDSDYMIAVARYLLSVGNLPPRHLRHARTKILGYCELLTSMANERHMEKTVTVTPDEKILEREIIDEDHPKKLIW